MKAVNAVLLAVLLLGCRSTQMTFHGLEPIDPRPAPTGFGGVPYWHTEVASLQPVFRWEEEAGAKYDFIVYEALMVRSAWEGRLVASPGREFFYAEGLSSPELHLPVALKAGAHYVWSVRSRTGDGAVSDWATFDAEAISNSGPGNMERYFHVYFWIKAPD